MQTVALPATIYNPTSPRTGFSGATMLRMRNVILVGSEDDIYLECYKGSLDLNETIPTQNLTGTLTAGVGATTIVGTATVFTTELRSGQMFWAVDDLFTVNAVIDDTHVTVYRGPTTALAGSTGQRLPVLFEINRQRGTLIQGNAVEFDKGTIIGVGTGTLRLNGAVLNASMVLTGTPQIAIYDQGTGLYAIRDLGFDPPDPAPTLGDVAGGTHGMQAGDYSVRLVQSSSVTQGFGNPGLRANVSLAAPDDRIEVDVTAITPDSGVDQYDAYATQTTTNPNQGPWNFVRSVPFSEIVADIFYLDYLDAEIARQGEVDFDNDPVPNCGFIAVIEGNPIWISCFGKMSDSPGPTVVPGKPQNIEAAPANWAVTSSPPQYIIGVIESLARLYMATPATLQQGVWAPTGDPLIPPLSMRPYWHMGFDNPYQLIFALGWLIGYPHGGPTKSIADSEDAKAQFFGGPVAEIVKDWIGANVFVTWDQNPLINAICFFHSADHLNDAGFWTTRVLVWGLNQGEWIGDVLLTDDTRDMVVTGVAAVDNQLVFLAGGRLGAGVQVDTFNWNTASGDPVEYFAAWQLQAGGISDRNKTVRAMRVNGGFTEGVLDLYGFDSEVAENLTDLEDGTNSLVSIPIGTTGGIVTTERSRMNVPSLFMFTPRVSGTYSGAGDADRINGAVLEFMPQGVRR